MRRRGFSLLEVMVAVALFGAVITIILSAQTGLVASNKTAANMSQAIELARCRMSELEEKQLKLGFPEIEEKDSNPVCCDDKEVPGFSCEWQVERVVLPQATQLAGDAGLSSILGGGLGLEGGLPAIPTGLPTGLPAGLPTGLGAPISNPLGGAQLDLDAGLQNVGQSLMQATGGAGMSGLLSMAFTMVYPSLKPLLEVAIRRVTVIVKWKEGIASRDFTLVQYITNPSRAGLLAGLADAGPMADGGLPTNLGGGSPQQGAGPQPGAAPLLSPFGGAPR
jgi:general secretion pathway protein I